MRVIIVGAGIGGLTCAIACRRENLDVIVLERSPELLPVGAGIQIPPNGVRVLQELGLKEEVLQKGAIVESMDLRRYKNGELITSMECDETVAREYGAPWIIIHRADYQQILFDRAMVMGVEVRFGATVDDLDFQDTQVVLESGETVAGDIIIGADGLWSKVRDTIFDRPCPPIETGDMAYRAVFPRKQLVALGDPEIDSLCSKTSSAAYDLLHIICGKVEVMPPARIRYLEQGGSVTLLGDACHPTLPYQAQGAAMASEDGTVLGLLLGSIVKCLENQPDSSEITLRDLVSKSLTVYEDLRKPRTTANVNGALRNRGAFHMPDGILQWMRDLVLGYSGMTHETDWIGLMSRRQSHTLAYDAVEECKIRIKEA
ncbi:hypothetical protein APSETT445_002453 [Aspergillus pseudonomiae]